jgi:hypothetical protein
LAPQALLRQAPQALSNWHISYKSAAGPSLTRARVSTELIEQCSGLGLAQTLEIVKLFNRKMVVSFLLTFPAKKGS